MIKSYSDKKEVQMELSSLDMTVIIIITRDGKAHQVLQHRNDERSPAKSITMNIPVMTARFAIMQFAPELDIVLVKWGVQ